MRRLSRQPFPILAIPLILSKLLLLGVLGVLAVNLSPANGVEEEPRRVTFDGRRKEDLAWSPDGKRLACSYYHKNGRIGIGIMEFPGGEWNVLTQVPVERMPAWSPDGKRLVFVHVSLSGTDGELDIYQMNADGTERKPLVAERKVFERSPSWSPDGTRLVYVTNRDKTQELYVADADGGNPRRLTSDPSQKQHPRWSPDGRQILFNANTESGFDLYLIDADGKNLRRLTDHPAMDAAPAWSPDGKRIAFASLRDDNPEIYVMNADGTGLRNVSRYPGYDFSPAWMPDGKTLTWVSDRDGGYDVYALVP
jgi:TolB protein